MQPLLSVQNLTLTFAGKETPALSSVSFDIFPGEVLGIAGESGSGKSLSSMAIMGILPPNAIVSNESKIIFHSSSGVIDLLASTEAVKQKIRGKEAGMIFQEPMTSLNPVIQCGKQVAEVLEIHQSLSKTESREKVIELFEKVKLPRPGELFKAWPHQL